jgi:ubiquinone biosynthesis protein COQ9
MSLLEQSVERDAALMALMAADPFPGWNLAALRQVAGEHADLLFLGGAAEMVEASIDLADRRMEQAALGLDMEGWRTPERIRAVIALRLRQNRPFKLAIGRALAVLALPGRGFMAARATARTVDAIWHAARDTAADFSWYTKRATLAPVYGATILFWLADKSGDDAATLEFLDRRLAQVAMIGKLRRRFFPKAA